MRGLTGALNLPDPDGFYAELVRVYDGLDRDAAEVVSARLILLLCNHIGDRSVLREAFALARGAGPAKE
jgi:hypothetical protein